MESQIPVEVQRLNVLRRRSTSIIADSKENVITKSQPERRSQSTTGPDYETTSHAGENDDNTQTESTPREEKNTEQVSQGPSANNFGFSTHYMQKNPPPPVVVVDPRFRRVIEPENGVEEKKSDTACSKNILTPKEKKGKELLNRISSSSRFSECLESFGSDKSDRSVNFSLCDSKETVGCIDDMLIRDAAERNLRQHLEKLDALCESQPRTGFQRPLLNRIIGCDGGLRRFESESSVSNNRSIHDFVCRIGREAQHFFCRKKRKETVHDGKVICTGCAESMVSIQKSIDSLRDIINKPTDEANQSKNRQGWFKGNENTCGEKLIILFLLVIILMLSITMIYYLILPPTPPPPSSWW